ncbi:MAG TPA: glycosyltransferase family 39 protein, partial [Thermoanaerobaculia bacterium]|nr:glycosyltransferase family 39 protein [Thermoanaerobaculia bacterium]
MTPPSVVADVRALEASRGVAAWRSPLSLVGLAAVAAARLLTLPASIWEYDEVLFVRGVESFEPLAHRPHPPGYPLLVGLGKMAAAILGDPFRGLVALSVLASLVGYLALVDTFARIAPGDRESREARWAGVAGAVLFALSPPMLVYGPLALSEAPALAFVALALAAGARLVERPSSVVAATCGAFATAAVGCRPQLIVAVAPMLAVIVVLVAIRARRGDGNGAQGTPVMPTGRATRRGDELRAPGIAAALAPLIALGVGFAAVTAAWLVPLVNATGGVSKLRLLLGSQANLVAAN